MDKQPIKRIEISDGDKRILVEFETAQDMSADEVREYAEGMKAGLNGEKQTEYIWQPYVVPYVVPNPPYRIYPYTNPYTITVISSGTTNALSGWSLVSGSTSDVVVQ